MMIVSTFNNTAKRRRELMEEFIVGLEVNGSGETSGRKMVLPIKEIRAPDGPQFTLMDN